MVLIKKIMASLPLCSTILNGNSKVSWASKILSNILIIRKFCRLFLSFFEMLVFTKSKIDNRLHKHFINFYSGAIF